MQFCLRCILAEGMPNIVLNAWSEVSEEVIQRPLRRLGESTALDSSKDSEQRGQLAGVAAYLIGG